MQSTAAIDAFRRELDQRATSKGAMRLQGSSYMQMVWQGYKFGGKILNYVSNGDDVLMRVSFDAPEGALYGVIQHALNPELSAEQHEAAAVHDLRFRWDGDVQSWFLQGNCDGSVLGIDERTRFDDENLAQCCVNWLSAQ